jgi:hypothetical protein
MLTKQAVPPTLNAVFRTSFNTRSSEAPVSSTRPGMLRGRSRPHPSPGPAASLASERRKDPLHSLQDAGYFVGIVGNQTTHAGRFLRELNLPCDILATSDDWGVTKPSVEFFTKLINVSGTQSTRSPTSVTASTTTSAPPLPLARSPSR